MVWLVYFKSLKRTQVGTFNEFLGFLFYLDTKSSPVHFLLLIYLFIFFTLQYCIGFAIH